MTDTATATATADLPDASRGTVEIKARAVERIAVAAARATDHVTRHSSGIRKLSGRDLPSASVEVRGSRVRASVVVAVIWPTPIAAVASRVRAAVAHDLRVYGNFDVERVDVSVHCIAPEDAATDRGRVQ